MANVLGMGVAVITSTCGGILAFSHSFARWATPKRCCSSTITNPRFLNCTTSSITACVPTTMWMVSSINPFKILLRSAVFVLPVSIASSMGISLSSLDKLAKCCWARISVGAIIQLWYPLSVANNILNKATIVLPLPTSPCKSRFI